MRGFCMIAHEATNKGELSYKRGDIIRVLQFTDCKKGSWWMAELGGVQGWVQNNMIQLMTSSWFRPDINRKEAEDLLMSEECDDGYYVMREKNPGCYTLSVRWEDTVKHIKVNECPLDKFFIRQGMKFHNFYAMVCHYHYHPLKAGIRLQPWHDFGFSAYALWASDDIEDGDLQFVRKDVIRVVDWSHPYMWIGLVEGRYGGFSHESVYVKDSDIAAFSLKHLNKLDGLGDDLQAYVDDLSTSP